MKTVNGWAFPDADQFMVGELQFDGTYQSANLREALRFVTEFGCAIDGGAHVGTWSKLMAEAFEKVVAFEPAADTFECLLENLKAFEQVQCEPYALGAESGGVSMVLDAANEARSNTGGRRIQAGGDIPTRTIDSYQLQRVGFIKLDIEGSEPMALQGATDTITRCRPIVLFENKRLWNRYFGLPKNAVTEILEGHGYRLLSQMSCDQIWGPR